ncbi:MAG TPA: acylneuraminate cytidylyltransferase family protein [Bdellovibrionota bacterium]|jgi:N-acylneuraminate cytidylyltransferase
MKWIAFIPARAGSLRVKSKNIRPLLGHPLLAYSIAAARATKLFDRIILTTDSEEFQEIGRYYGAEVPFLRPQEFASSTSPDIEWLKHAYGELGNYSFDAFAIVRPTSPLRGAATILKAARQLVESPGVDSLRAVQLCTEHPGKMWTIENDHLKTFLPQEHMEVPWHARQYQDLPKVYVQNSSLEVARSYVVPKYNSREGRTIAPFLTDEYEGLAVDYEFDLRLIEDCVLSGKAKLPEIDKPPLPGLENLFKD